LPIFDPPKNVTTLYHQPYPPDLSPPNNFLFPKLKIKLKGLLFAGVVEIQEAATEKLKQVQKEEFSAAFQKMYDRAKPVNISMEPILILKMYCLPHASSIFKKSVLKLLDHTVYVTHGSLLRPFGVTPCFVAM